MKAGNAGSNPDGVATAMIAQSFPLETLLEEIGSAVFSLNTTVVGLDAVENGYEKPESLDISWNPGDRRAAARKTRKFMIESVLIHVSEAVNQYVMALSKLPRFANFRERWVRSQTSAAMRFQELGAELLGKDEYLIAAATLLIHWRNRVVHESSRAKLLPEQKSLLRKNEEEIAQNYKSLSVDCLLCHFEEARPTLKDVSTLISMAINLAKRMDSRVHRRLDRADLQAWLDHYGLSPILEKVKAETKPDKMQSSIRRVFLSHGPELLPHYERLYPQQEREQ